MGSLPDPAASKVPPLVVSTPWRAKRLTREVVMAHYPPKADDGTPGDAQSQFSTLLHLVFVDGIGVDANDLRADLAGIGTLALETGDLALQNDIARTRAFADCTLLGLKTTQKLTKHTEAIDGLHTAVIDLLKDPRLERDPLGACLIVVEFSEAILPYVALNLALLRDTLSAELRATLIGKLRQAQSLLLIRTRTCSDAFVLEGGESVHTRYFDLQGNLHATIDYVSALR